MPTEKRLDIKALLTNNIYVLAGVGSLLLWWLVCHFIKPETPIFFNECTEEYPVYMWFVSLAALSVPVIAYLCSKSFRALPWTQQLLSVGLVLLLASVVHRPRTYLDAQVIFFVCTLVAFAFDKQRRFNWPSLFQITMILYFTWVALSMLWTTDKHDGQHFLNHLVPVLAYPIAFLFIHTDKDNFQALLLVFVRVALIACLLSVGCGIYEAARGGVPCTVFLELKKFLFLNLIPVYNVVFAWSGACHPSYNAIWITATAAALFYLRDKQRLSALETGYGCLLTLLVLIISQSRVGFVMWVIVCFAGVIYLLRNSKVKLAIALTVFLLLLAGILIANPMWSHNFTEDYSRSRLFKIAQDYIAVTPWYGTGIGSLTYAHVEEVIGYEFQKWWPDYATATAFYPHNQFLGDWMQTGVAGLILLIVMLLSVFYNAFRTRRYLPFVFTLALLPLMLIEMPFRFLAGSTIIALSWCFTLCNYEDTH